MLRTRWILSSHVGLRAVAPKFRMAMGNLHWWWLSRFSVEKVWLDAWPCLSKSVLQCFYLERRICSIIVLRWDSFSSCFFCIGLGTRTILANCLGNDMGKACLCVHMKLVELLWSSKCIRTQTTRCLGASVILIANACQCSVIAAIISAVSYLHTVYREPPRLFEIGLVWRCITYDWSHWCEQMSTPSHAGSSSTCIFSRGMKQGALERQYCLWWMQLTWQWFWTLGPAMEHKTSSNRQLGRTQHSPLSWNLFFCWQLQFNALKSTWQLVHQMLW